MGGNAGGCHRLARGEATAGCMCTWGCRRTNCLSVQYPIASEDCSGSVGVVAVGLIAAPLGRLQVMAWVHGRTSRPYVKTLRNQHNGWDSVMRRAEHAVLFEWHSCNRSLPRIGYVNGSVLAFIRLGQTSLSPSKPRRRCGHIGYSNKPYILYPAGGQRGGDAVPRGSVQGGAQGGGRAHCRGGAQPRGALPAPRRQEAQRQEAPRTKGAALTIRSKTLNSEATKP